MSTFIKRIRGFIKSEDGPTAVEYAVMVALIAVAIIVGVRSLGTSMNSTFSNIGTTVGGLPTSN
ncbi:Flp family type IVb pilin [Tautonia rosea]|uniref:Flp family type IVb pilin n=1 Tax=Tautonia rosea TaxID=2728037 RepID=UPI0014750EA6|nr:Flp family type IVb pilin [Tautonia rosea]